MDQSGISSSFLRRLASYGREVCPTGPQYTRVFFFLCLFFPLNICCFALSCFFSLSTCKGTHRPTHRRPSLKPSDDSSFSPKRTMRKSETDNEKTAEGKGFLFCFFVALKHNNLVPFQRTPLHTHRCTSSSYGPPSIPIFFFFSSFQKDEIKNSFHSRWKILFVSPARESVWRGVLSHPPPPSPSRPLLFRPSANGGNKNYIIPSPSPPLPPPSSSVVELK